MQIVPGFPGYYFVKNINIVNNIIIVYYICIVNYQCMTPNKELQESRMRGYFIEATREILKGEGLKALNVRAVAERAGYSYATLYNYFKDLNELVFICVNDFMLECESFVDDQTRQQQPGRQRLKQRMMAFIRYFTQYPGIFELFFIERMNSINSQHPTAAAIYHFTDRITDADLSVVVNEGKADDETAEAIRLSLRNAATGMLLFYIHRMQPGGYKDFIDSAERQLDFILGRD